MTRHEAESRRAKFGICAGMIAALSLVAVIAILQGQDAKDEQRLRAQVAEKSRK